MGEGAKRNGALNFQIVGLFKAVGEFTIRGVNCHFADLTTFHHTT
jgi:hypothetical protein